MHENLVVRALLTRRQRIRLRYLALALLLVAPAVATDWVEGRIAAISTRSGQAAEALLERLTADLLDDLVPEPTPDLLRPGRPQ